MLLDCFLLVRPESAEWLTDKANDRTQSAFFNFAVASTVVEFIFKEIELILAKRQRYLIRLKTTFSSKGTWGK